MCNLFKNIGFIMNKYYSIKLTYSTIFPQYFLVFLFSKIYSFYFQSPPEWSKKRSYTTNITTISKQHKITINGPKGPGRRPAVPKGPYIRDTRPKAVLARRALAGGFGGAQLPQVLSEQEGCERSSPYNSRPMNKGNLFPEVHGRLLYVHQFNFSHNGHYIGAGS